MNSASAEDRIEDLNRWCRRCKLFFVSIFLSLRKFPVTQQLSGPGIAVESPLLAERMSKLADLVLASSG